jgi:glycerol uptake facilitator protein
MNNFLFELIGTAFLILLGDGVVANVVLNRTKGNNSGWIVITFGWAIAVFVGVYISAAQSGAHLNPAVTIALAVAGKFDWALVPVQIAAQFCGAMIGAFLVWLTYKKHFDETADADGCILYRPGHTKYSFQLNWRNHWHICPGVWCAFYCRCTY